MLKRNHRSSGRTMIGPAQIHGLAEGDTITTVADHRVIGKTGRVTGRIAPGTVGEVIISIRGGSEGYYAYASDAKETIEAGERVVVVDYEEPRTVLVSRFE